MRNPLPYILIVLLTALASLRADPAPELMALDAARVGEGNMRVSSRIEVREQGETIRVNEYEVYLGTNRRSLALVRTGRDAGQKVLMLDDQFWLFLPSSQRPIRITPLQKLLGEASIGDVTSLRWQEDYRVVERQDADDSHRSLIMEAARPGLSYERIELIIRSDNYAPVSGRFYLRSGKLAKTARFHIEAQQTGWLITGMTLADEVMKGSETVVLYQGVTPVDIPERWFSPAFLARNTLN
jgi:hypothetical protein